MEQVFYLTHLRLVSLSLFVFPHEWQRRAVEYVVLGQAILSLLAVIYLHRTYISSYQNKSSCLDVIFSQSYDFLGSDRGTYQRYPYDRLIHQKKPLDSSITVKNDIFLRNDTYAIVRMRILPSSYLIDQEYIEVITFEATEHDLNRSYEYAFTQRYIDNMKKQYGLRSMWELYRNVKYRYDSVENDREDDHRQRSAQDESIESTSSVDDSLRRNHASECNIEGSTCSEDWGETVVEAEKRLPDKDCLSREHLERVDQEQCKGSRQNNLEEIASTSLLYPWKYGSLYEFVQSLNFFLEHRSVFVYAMEKDLILPPKHGDYSHPVRNITVFDVVIPSSHSCLGSEMPRTFLQYFVGYDTIVINWAISAFGPRGYIYNYYSQELFSLNIAFDFISLSINPATLKSKSKLTNNLSEFKNSSDSSVWSINLNDSQLAMKIIYKIGVVITTVSLFFTTSTIVSFMLRETQQRMLKFTYLLHHHVSHRIPIIYLVFTHLIETLVFVPIMIGIVFLMFQFFKDQMLTFLVWSLVWSSEVFSVLCLFHIYFFSRPFGFSYAALWTSFLFIFHAMVHFYYRFEIPAILLGVVRSDMPRVGLQAVPTMQFNASIPPIAGPVGAVSRQENSVASNGSNRVTESGSVINPSTQSTRSDSSSNETIRGANSPLHMTEMAIITSISNRSRTSSGQSVGNSQSNGLGPHRGPSPAPDTRTGSSRYSRAASPALSDYGSGKSQEDRSDPSLESIHSFRGLYTPERPHRSRRRASSHGPTFQGQTNQENTSTSSMFFNTDTASISTQDQPRQTNQAASRGQFYLLQENGSIPLLGMVGAAGSNINGGQSTGDISLLNSPINRRDRISVDDDDNMRDQRLSSDDRMGYIFLS